MKVGVVGAGVMGADIALLLSNVGHEVTQVDISAKALKKAETTCHNRILQLDEAGIREEEKICSNISYTISIESLDDSEFVIEAIVERLNAKRKLMKRLEKLISSNCVIATNTSSYMVSEVAENMKHPERVVLMHFSNPPILRDFVEVAKGRATSDETLNFALKIAGDIRKTPIVPQKECRGYILNRLLTAGLIATSWDYAEGARPEVIDATYRSLGSPTGVFELIDLIGIDVVYYVYKNFREFYGKRFDLQEDFLKMIESMIDEGRLGKKSGEGFYKWENGKAKIPETTPGYDLTGVVASVVNEAFRIIEDGIGDRETVNKTYMLAAGAPVGVFDLGELVGFEKMKDRLGELYSTRKNELFKPANTFIEEAG